MSTLPWWRDAVIYQIYPRSFADADGDGIGDLPGITARLEHLRDLGVDALWLSPFYVSPQHDAGYDVADFRDVDPLFGTLADFDVLLDRAHRLGLRVIVDLVPNHSSNEHSWFQAALAAPPGSPERARYVFRDGRGDQGEQPPNNWVSNFGGPAWTRVTEPDGRPGQYYLHLFDSSQPDFDWTNDEVREEFESILRFWLDRGVDGFRVDVAHGLVKAQGLPDADLSIDPHVDTTTLLPMWDQPGVHDIYRRWRSIVDDYSEDLVDVWGDDADRVLCAEAWVQPSEALSRYVRPDELHQSFNFGYLMTPWIAGELRASIADSLAATETVGAPQTWVLSNHDVVRHASRFGYPQRPGLARMPGIGADDPQPDAELGLRRARAATALMLALPGSAYLYQGEELGLPEATRLPDDARQDPTWERSAHTDRGRDGCRVPLPWSADDPSFGFGPSALSWLPQPDELGSLAVDRQDGTEGSTLELYRRLLTLRRSRGLGRGELSWSDDQDGDAVAFHIRSGDLDTVVIANLGPSTLPLPEHLTPLVSSGPLDGQGLPPDTTVWLRHLHRP
ncbi:glycoside hydrolase family 13 protein [Aeromicrobium sp. YIM 150415]|uniref:glycoside hydrolase family 13 protein n=1 Tax=Aeromicrobium sp. YIM 150415 TaxID=2803912 RepID=UPI0019652DD7|nr:glycoside hydrolase family 13 protein [Aeromicrobium sp. YIM 150415]MBM9463290.1 glycoside hydrolase family 13 protein [Aeromicrobium sp. YIM 150415]